MNGFEIQMGSQPLLYTFRINYITIVIQPETRDLLSRYGKA